MDTKTIIIAIVVIILLFFAYRYYEGKTLIPQQLGPTPRTGPATAPVSGAVTAKKS